MDAALRINGKSQSLTRAQLAQSAVFAARFSFAALIMVAPFRLRWTIAARPFEPLFREYTDLFLFASDVFLMTTLAFWLISLLLQPRRVTIAPLSMSLMLLGFTLAAALAVFNSIDASLAREHSARLFLLGGLYLFILNEIKSLAQLTIPVALQIVLQSVIAVWQSTQQHSVGLPWLGELSLDPARSGISIVLADGSRTLRAYGLTDHPNILGGGLAFALILLMTIRLEMRPARSSFASLAFFATFAIGLLALFFTYSRAAWLAFTIGTAIVSVWLWRARLPRARRDLLALAALGVIVVAPLTLANAGNLGARLNAANSPAAVWTEARSLTERDTVNQATLNLITNDPLSIFGIGVGTLPRALLAQNPQLDSYYQPAHLALLNAAAETGSVGAGFYLALMLAPFFVLWQKRARIVFTPALIGASALLLAITVVGFFDYYTWLLTAGRLWQWIGWGGWSVAYQRAAKKAHPFAGD